MALMSAGRIPFASCNPRIYTLYWYGLEQMLKNRQCSLFRLVAGAVLSGVLSLTLAPVCGSAMDVDSELCCERHGCLSTTHNAPSSMRGIMHHAGGESETTLQYGSVGYNTDRCCEQIGRAHV